MIKDKSENKPNLEQVGSSHWRKTGAELLLVSATLVWGSTFLVVQNSIKVVGPLSFIALRFGVGALALAILFHRGLFRLTRIELIGGFLIGIFLFGGYILQTLGLQYTTSSKAGFITGLNVVFVPILGLLIFRQWPTLGAILGVTLATIGMGLLSIGQNFNLEFGIGELMVLGCAFCFAWQVILVSHFAPGRNAYNLAIVQIATTALLSAVIAPLVGEPMVIPPLEVWGAILYMGLIGTAFTFAVMNRVQQFTSPTRAALIYALEPVFAGLFGYFAGELLSIPALIGCGLIVGGMILSELRFKAADKTLLVGVENDVSRVTPSGIPD